MLITDITLEMVRDKVQHIQQTFSLHKQLFDKIRADLDQVPFSVIGRNEFIKRQLIDVMTFTKSQKEMIE